MKYEVKYPANGKIKNNADRLRYIYRLEKRLTIIHNGKSKTLTPNKMKAWIKTEFEPRMEAVLRERARLRAELENDNTFDLVIVDPLTAFSEV